MARILLGVSGGIAAYKSLELGPARDQAGHGVRVLMTEGAKRFVGPASFEGIVGAPVLSRSSSATRCAARSPATRGPSTTRSATSRSSANADAYLVAPASANTIAKLAAGIADSMVTTSFLACTAPRLVAPAMNDRMYADAATQANLATLRERGVRGDRARRGLARLARRARQGPAARAGRACWPRSRRVLPGGERPWDGLRVLVTRRRHAGADRPRPLHRQPLQRPDGPGARRRRRPARRRGDAGRRQRRAARRRPGCAGSTSRPPPSSTTAVQAEFPALPRPADGRGAGRLPARARSPTTRSSARRGGLDSRLEPTEDILAGRRRGEARGPDDRRLRGRARRRTPSSARARSWFARAPT